MSTWEVKLQHLKAYGEEMVADGEQFGAQAEAQVAGLEASALGIGADSRFTEIAALKAAAAKHADQLGGFAEDMADGIGSYGAAAIISHDTYGFADQTAQEELDAIRQLIAQHTTIG